MSEGVARMQGNEVTADYAADCVGTVWVRTPKGEWRYVTNDSELSWDSFYMPPEQYAPYVELDEAAARVLGRGLASRG
jgi:hypothetical protein